MVCWDPASAKKNRTNPTDVPSIFYRLPADRFGTALIKPDVRAPRVLFVALSNIGDLVLTTPALQAVHAAYPDHLIDIVADIRSSELLRACPYLGTLHHRHKAEGLRGTLRLIATLRTQSYAAIVDLRTDFLPWLLKGARRTARWRRPPHGPHAAEQHFAIASRVLPSAENIPDAQVWISSLDLEFAENFLRPAAAGRWLALAPGANWPGKIWPAAYFAELIERVADTFSGVMILGSAQDRMVAAHLGQGCRLPCLNLAGTTSLTQAAALLDHVTVFVGNDSGLGHIAAARGVPTLTLFGPGRPERYRPWGSKARLLQAPNRDLTALRASDVEAELRAIIH